jgi:hypothetical protein
MAAKTAGERGRGGAARYGRRETVTVLTGCLPGRSLLAVASNRQSFGKIYVSFAFHV